MRSVRTTAMLAVLYSAAFVAAFNENIVNVALVDVMGAFGVPASAAQWLVTGYMMVTTIIVAISAYLYRRVGLRRLFFAGIAFLAAGSIAAMFAPSFPLLLVFRLIQAIGTGIFIPSMMTAVLAVAPRKRLGLYLSVGGMMITFGPAFGPVVSGLMVTLFGWHLMFLPTLVVIVIVGGLGVFVVHDTAEPQAMGLDVLSVGLITLGMLGLVFGLSELTTRTGPAVGSVVAGLLFLAVFVRRQFRHENPVLSLRPMLSARFWPSTVLVVVGMMMTFSLSVLLPLYFQGSFGMTALAAGSLLLLPILINAATSIVGGKIMDSRGPWPLLVIGFLVIAAGQIVMFFVAPQLAWLGVLMASTVVFAGVGLVLSPSQTTGLSTLPGPEHPHGVALLNTFIQVAASIGPSLLIGILASGAEAGESTGVAPEQANADGFAQAIGVAALIAVAGAAVAFFYTRTISGTGRCGEAAGEPTIATLMRTEVFSVPATASVRAVMEVFVSKRISGVPLTDEGGGLCGYITDGDVLRAASAHASSAEMAFGLNVYQQDPDFHRRIEAVMELNVMEFANESVIAVDVDSSLEQVSKILGDRRMKKVPVLSGGSLVGVVTRGDLVRSLLGSFMRAGQQDADGGLDGSLLRDRPRSPA